MKKSILIILTILLSANLIFGQSKFYGLLSTGVSFPIGNFGDKSINNEKSGLAKTGYFINTAAGYNFTSIFGLELSISNQFYSTDFQEYISYFTNVGVPAPQVTTPKYYIINFFIGPTFTIDFSEKFNWRLKPLFGLTNGNISESSIRFTNGDYIKLSSGRGNNFGLALESQLNYKLSQRLSLMSTFNFQYSDLVFKNYVASSNVTSITSDLKFQFMALNLGLGIMFNF